MNKPAKAVFKFISMVEDYQRETGMCPQHYMDLRSELSQCYCLTNAGVLLNHVPMHNVTLKQVHSAYQKLLDLGLLDLTDSRITCLIQRLEDAKDTRRHNEAQLIQLQQDTEQQEHIIQNCTDVLQTNSELNQRLHKYNNKSWFWKMFTWYV